MLTYRAEHVDGAWHGGSDLMRLLGDPWPDTKLEDVIHRFAKTNRSENHDAATFCAHPYGDNDWDKDLFQLAFEVVHQKGDVVQSRPPLFEVAGDGAVR